MIYFIITTCLVIDPDGVRQRQYTDGIQRVIELTRGLPDVRLVIVENNGPRRTYLDDLGLEVIYTENNRLPTKNKGRKELLDVLHCVEALNMSDEDFVVKVTGRYLIDYGSPFMTAVETMDRQRIKAIIRFGSFLHNPKPVDSICGLVGLNVRYLRIIDVPGEEDWVEWSWARSAYMVPVDQRVELNTLGIFIAPAGNVFQLV
jgi:hypothetical protein